MIMSQSAADESLADAIWWLKGFAAAIPSDDRGTPLSLESSLREIRMWLGRLPYGLSRLVGTTESAFGIVLTEHEFEVFWDALRSPDDEVGAAARKQALEKLRLVLNKFTEERRAFATAGSREVPF